MVIFHSSVSLPDGILKLISWRNVPASHGTDCTTFAATRFGGPKDGGAVKLMVSIRGLTTGKAGYGDGGLCGSSSPVIKHGLVANGPLINDFPNQTSIQK